MATRIYDLAKDLGKKFDITVKSSDLALEIRDMTEFSDLKDTIKSHASTVDDDVAERIYEIYEERHAKPSQQQPKEDPEKAAEEARRQEEIRLKRQQLLEQQNRLKQNKVSEVEAARRAREEEIRRRQALNQQGPRVVAPPPPRPMSAPQPVNVNPLNKARKGPIPIPLPQRSIAPQSTSSAPPPLSEVARAADPGAGAAASAAAAPPPPKAPIRPTATATELRGGPRPTGYTSGPIDGRRSGPGVTPSLGRSRTDGQPPPPPPPNLHPDSPFRMRPPAPARPGALPRTAPGGPGGGPSSRSGDTRRDSGPTRPGSTRPGDRRPDRPGDRGPKAPGELIIPELEVMTLKGPGPRRGKPGGVGDKAKAPPPKKKGLKTIIREEIEVKPSKIYGLADEFRRPIGVKKPRQSGGRSTGDHRSKTVQRPTDPVRLGSTITVGEFAERIKVPSAEIIKKVFLMGKMLTINQLIGADLCELVAQDFGVQVDIQTEGDEQDIEMYRPTEDPEKLQTRPPVVTIMGHVDHGKTTLLDAFRKSKVAAGEFGGITQHIGAYHVETPKGEIVFLDTPGHEAFTSMRARGAQVTDIVVLVVGADDGVMPQTVEAINHAREAEVPIIVAINKMDLPQANPQRVRTELMQHQILSEDLGGSNIFVEISAKKGTNLDLLLEMILLQASVMELKADSTCRAEGTIIESHVDPLRGAVATVLVDKGTLHVGDIFVVGTESGRVRVMIDDSGKPTKATKPAHPVEVIGLSGTPEVGELFIVMAEERLAREIASRRVDRRRMRDLGTTRHVSLEGLHDLVAEGKLKDLKIILRGDVQGSVEAIIQSLTKLSNEEVKVRMLHTGTGGISESDIQLASASDAIVIGFNVRPDPAAASLAQHEGIEIKTYRVIYELIEEIQKAILGMLDKKYKEITTGRVEIREIFKVSRHGNIAGCYVLDGEITRGGEVRIVRNGVVAYQGKVATLRRVKDDVTKVASGFECGLTLENFQDIKKGDILEAFKMEEIPLEMAST